MVTRGQGREVQGTGTPHHTVRGKQATRQACVSRPLSGPLEAWSTKDAGHSLALSEAAPTSLSQQRKVSKGRGNGECHPRKVWRPSMTNPLADLPSGQRASSAKSTVIPFLRKLLSPPVMPGAPVRGQKWRRPAWATSEGRGESGRDRRVLLPSDRTRL